MSRPSRHVVRGILPLVLTLCVVLAGFSLMIIRQNNLHSFEQKIDLQIQNVTAKKDLGELIVSDLREVATFFYMILFSADRDRQQLLLSDAKLTTAEIYVALNLISDGGTLSNRLPLNLPDKGASDFTISYSPQSKQYYNLEVLILRPQLIALEKRLEQTISMTAIRNRLLHNPEGNLLQETGLQLRNYAKSIHSQLERMMENANKIAYDANRELLILHRNIASLR